MALAERTAPRRRAAHRRDRRGRWAGNLGLVTVGTIVVRLVPPISAVGAAVAADERGWGLLHAVGAVPTWLALVVSVVALDLAIYLQHVLFHAVPILWRLHRVHHT